MLKSFMRCIFGVSQIIKSILSKICLIVSRFDEIYITRKCTLLSFKRCLLGISQNIKSILSVYVWT